MLYIIEIPHFAIRSDLFHQLIFVRASSLLSTKAMSPQKVQKIGQKPHFLLHCIGHFSGDEKERGKHSHMITKSRKRTLLCLGRSLSKVDPKINIWPCFSQVNNSSKRSRWVNEKPISWSNNPSKYLKKRIKEMMMDGGQKNWEQSTALYCCSCFSQRNSSHAVCQENFNGKLFLWKQSSFLTLTEAKFLNKGKKCKYKKNWFAFNWSVLNIISIPRSIY